MAKPGVFISYDYGRDKVFKDCLLAWDVDGEFDFSSYDQIFDVGFGTPPATAVKEDLARRIFDGERSIRCSRGRIDLMEPREVVRERSRAAYLEHDHQYPEPERQQTDRDRPESPISTGVRHGMHRM